MKYYHSTDHIIDFPDYDTPYNNITNHNNGALGLWCAVDPSWISGFGKYVYEIEVDDEIKQYNMTIEELSTMANKSKEHHAELRLELLDQQFDIVRILEFAERCDMVVILNMNAIKTVTRTDGE